jgi:hypothetical protein
MSVDFWLGFIAGFVSAVGVLFIYVFLPEGNTDRDTPKRNKNDRSVFTS